mmetsp:Transcript_19232/g.73571  ORF Transcript_19232/g.73571 Transcript_19232/m.73571 type:complete len:235 (-) Transcript_19232:1207-1911(-)
MLAIAVSAPTRVARTSSAPDPVLTVAASASDPGCFRTGMLSPVMADSSATLRPASTTPSTGTRAPGATRTTSPSSSSLTATVRTTRPGWREAENTPMATASALASASSSSPPSSSSALGRPSPAAAGGLVACTVDSSTCAASTGPPDSASACSAAAAAAAVSALAAAPAGSSTAASSGCSISREVSAEAVRPLAALSRYFPSTTKVRISAPASKKSAALCSPPDAMAMDSSTTE